MLELKNEYQKKKVLIKERISDFKSLTKENYIYELIFCTLTPQSQAKKCWQAVEELKPLLKNLNEEKISQILKSKTRFHKNKSRYVLNNIKNWSEIEKELQNSDIKELRNWLSENVYGFGLKEASHFLRNIGKSNNEIAILDRHILKNLQQNQVIEENKIKNKKDYLEIETKFINFSKELAIPLDELDLLFWSQENGEIFK